MNLTKTIPMELTVRQAVKWIGESAVSGEHGTRSLTFELMEEGQPWTVPDGIRAALAFRCEGGSEGEYDTMPDGSDAWEVSGNRVTVRLIDAILARPGRVLLALILRDQFLRSLSTFPMFLTVSEGLEDLAELPVRYYAVRNLEEVNSAISELSDRVDAVDTEANRTASKEAREAAEAVKRYAEILDPEELDRRIESKGDDLYLADGRIHLTANGQIIGDGIPEPEGGGLAFDGGYVDEGNLLHLTMEGADIEGFEPIELPAGGGGGDSGSRLTVAMKTPSEVVAAEHSEEVWLEFGFTSVDAVTNVATGSGTMQLTVDGEVKRTGPIEQGDVRLNIRPWLRAGANAVKLTVTDSYGGRAVRNLTVTLETLSLSWNLENTAMTESALSVSLTAVGNGSKTVHLQVDGVDCEVFTVSTSGRRTTKVIPVQVHGGHTVTAWAEMEVAGVTMTSDVLSCAVAWVRDPVVPAIACTKIPGAVDQFSTVSLVHRVVDPVNNPTTVQYLVGGAVFKEEQVDQAEHTWSVRLTNAGTTVLSIVCGDVRVDRIIDVRSIGVDVQEVTDGLHLKVDPAAMADLEAWAEGSYRFTLSEGFDLVNGGLTMDELGRRCIRVTAGDRLTLNYPLFGPDARTYGLGAKLIYAVRNPSAKHCTAISCLQNNVGLEVQANNVYLRGNQTVCKLSTCEDEYTELDITIQPDTNDGIMHLWESCSTFAYMKYAADESFTHTVQPGITFGCDDADVYLYLVRFYGRDLSDEERRANYIADGTDTVQILDRQSRNDIYDSTGSIDIEKCAARNPDCHHIVISAERMTKGKKDEVKGTIRHIYRSGGPEHQWSTDVSMFVQGTSSVEHAETAGPNINFYFPQGITLENGTVVADGYAMNGRDKSMPVLELTYKKNIASEDHIVNRATAEWYNRYQPSVRPERIADPRVRDCLDSCMCAVYFHNTGSSAVQVGPDMVPPGATIFFGLGNLCSNKDSVAAFGYHPIVIEVKNNTEPQVRFKAKDLSGDNWSNNYEFRYLDTTKYTEEQAKAEWQKVQNFLYEVDCTAATDAVLPTAVTINGVSFVRDSVEYRKARWDAESPEIFDKWTLTFHHNITLFLMLRDNRAKNMFWSLDPVTRKWGLWFNWDNDTGLCRNNDGYVDIKPGWMDYDRLGTGDVFNGADNVLFVNLRTWDFALLKEHYLDRESAGAWEIDGFYRYAMESQEAVCEALWIEDAHHNAIRTMQNLGTTAYLERATGRLRLHIKKALTFQKALIDSYYCSTGATGQSAAFRGYTPSRWEAVEPNGKISVTTYTNLFVNVHAGSTDYQVRAYEGVPVELDVSAELNNTEFYFRSAQWLQDLGDLSGLYLGQFEGSPLKRVRRLLIGSDKSGYYNTNFTQASFDNCVKLEELNLGGLTNAKRSFDFSPNLYLKNLYTRGSGVTGVTFARRGRLQTARLNAVKSLAMQDLHRLEEFSMPTYADLTSLRIGGCAAVDTAAMVTDAQALTHVRLTDVDWNMADASVLLKLTGCRGWDDDGREADTAVLTGKAYVEKLSREELDAVNAAFPQLELSYGSIVLSFSVTFCNWDGSTLKLKDGSDAAFRVAEGGTVRDPVSAGLMDAPQRPSDVEKHYTYGGWDTSLRNVTEDRIIKAVHIPSDRYYRVTWWADTAETKANQEEQIIAHGTSVYTGGEPAEDGKLWLGWDKSADNVVCDLDIHPVFVTPVLPEVIPGQFDYLYSDDPTDDSAYTLAEFAGILEQGRAKTYFQVGDRIKIVPHTEVFADSTIELRVEGFNHFRLADGSGFAGVVFGMVGIMNAKHRMNAEATNIGGWPETEMRAFLNDTIFPALPIQWKKLIRQVEVRSSAGGTKPDIVTSKDHLTLYALAEIGIDQTVVPYCNEIDPDAEQNAFAAYTDNESRCKGMYNGTGTRGIYYFRSPNAGSANQFRAWDGYYAPSFPAASEHYITWLCCMGVECV